MQLFLPTLSPLSTLVGLQVRATDVLGRSGPQAKGATVKLCVTDTQLVITLAEDGPDNAAVTHRTAFELERIVPSLKSTTNMVAFMGGPEEAPVRWALQTPQALEVKQAMLDALRGRSDERARRIARATMLNEFSSQEDEEAALMEMRACSAVPALATTSRWASPRGAIPAADRVDKGKGKGRPFSQVQPVAGGAADIYDLPANDRSRCVRGGTTANEPAPPPPPAPVFGVRAAKRTRPPSTASTQSSEGDCPSLSTAPQLPSVASAGRSTPHPLSRLLASEAAANVANRRSSPSCTENCASALLASRPLPPTPMGAAGSETPPRHNVGEELESRRSMGAALVACNSSILSMHQETAPSTDCLPIHTSDQQAKVKNAPAPYAAVDVATILAARCIAGMSSGEICGYDNNSSDHIIEEEDSYSLATLESDTSPRRRCLNGKQPPAKAPRPSNAVRHRPRNRHGTVTVMPDEAEQGREAGRRPSRGLLADLFPAPCADDDTDSSKAETEAAAHEEAYEGFGAGMVEGM